MQVVGSDGRFEIPHHLMRSGSDEERVPAVDSRRACFVIADLQ